MNRRRFLIHTGAAAAALLTGDVHAQTWPSRSITFVVPFPPGGSNDVFARAIADKLSASLGVPVVIDNRGGAGGTIGSAAVARMRGLYRAPIASAKMEMRQAIAALRTALLGFFGFAQQVLDAIAVLFRFIENEQHFGRAPHVQALHQFVPHVTFRGLQAF